MAAATLTAPKCLLLVNVEAAMEAGWAAGCQQAAQLFVKAVS